MKYLATRLVGSPKATPMPKFLPRPTSVAPALGDSPNSKPTAPKQAIQRLTTPPQRSKRGSASHFWAVPATIQRIAAESHAETVAEVPRAWKIEPSRGVPHTVSAHTLAVCTSRDASPGDEVTRCNTHKYPELQV